jgi:hypothetical protein
MTVDEKFNRKKSARISEASFFMSRNETPGAEEPIEVTLLDGENPDHPRYLRISLSYEEADKLAARILKTAKVVSWSSRGCVEHWENQR